MNKKIAKGLMSRAINIWMLQEHSEVFFPKEDDIRKEEEGYQCKIHVVRIASEYFYGKQNYHCSLHITDNTVRISIYHFDEKGNIVTDYQTSLF